MKELQIFCPRCTQRCDVNLEPGDLTENSTTEGLEWTCAKCGCDFRFDVYVDVMNKEEV